MGLETQLIMRHSQLDMFAQLTVPEGYTIHTPREGTPEIWREIVVSAFGFDADYADKTDRPGWLPERMFFLELDNTDVATATTYDHPDYPGEGFLHMVGTRKEYAGRGAGKLVVMAALNWLYHHGYKSCVLSTDDERLPALHMYYKLGFRPVIENEEKRERWRKVYKNLGIDTEF